MSRPRVLILAFVALATACVSLGHQPRGTVDRLVKSVAANGFPIPATDVKFLLRESGFQGCRTDDGNDHRLMSFDCHGSAVEFFMLPTPEGELRLAIVRIQGSEASRQEAEQLMARWILQIGTSIDPTKDLVTQVPLSRGSVRVHVAIEPSEHGVRPLLVLADPDFAYAE